MTYIDTLDPCKNCKEGTYVDYVDGTRCRSCGAGKPESRPKPTGKRKVNE